MTLIYQYSEDINKATRKYEKNYCNLCTHSGGDRIRLFLLGETATRIQRNRVYNYQVIRKGLLILSEEYNKGAEKVQYLKEYEETKNKIVKEH